MKKYIILHEDEITKEIKNGLKVNKYNVLTLIYEKDVNGEYTDIVTKYLVASYFNKNEIPEVLKTYKKLNKVEINKAIDIISNKGHYPRFINLVSRSSAFNDPEGSRVRFKGTFKLTIAPGQTGVATYDFDDVRLITGGFYKASGANFGDNFDIEIIHPIDGSLDKFIDGWYVSDIQTNIETYKSKILSGLKIKLTYRNVGVNSVDFFANLYLHKI